MDKQKMVEGIRLIVIISVLIIIIVGSYKNIMSQEKLNNNIDSITKKESTNLKDTESPNLILKEVTINEGEQYSIDDFIDSCEDNSGNKCILSYSNGIRYKIAGVYDIGIIARDQDDNKIEKTTKLIIDRKSNSKNINYTSDTYNYEGTPDNIVSLTNEVYEITNKYRLLVGVSPLKHDLSLEEAANVRAKEISNTFSHTRPNGTTCFTILSDLGISYGTAGENIALGYKTPEDVMEGWKNSSGHYQNIISSKFNKIGIGIYENNNQHYWVQIFSN